MSRPKTKTELLELGKLNFDKLMNYVDGFSEEEQNKEFPEGTMNRNIRDVLAHLHHWHLMMMEWYQVGMSGKKPKMPAKGYTWKTTPDLNRWIWEEYNSMPLDEAKYQLKKGFSNLRKIIEVHSNEELFTKKHYKWTGTTSLGSYLVSATSSHYDWAYNLIKKGKVN